MTIGFDGFWAVYNQTNRGNLCRRTILALTHYAPEHKYFIYSDYRTENRHITPLLTNANVVLKEPKHGWFMRLWRWGDGMGKDLKRHHVKLYHGLCEVLPYGTRNRNMHWVLSINDLDIHRFPKEHGLWKRLKKKLSLRHSMRKAERIVVPSEWGKRDLLQHFPKLNPEHVFVVPPCVDNSFNIHVHEEVKRNLATKHGLPEQFVLVMGPLSAHKNILTLVKAIEQMPRRQRITLVIAGQSTKYYRNVIRPYLDAHSLRDNVVHIKSIHQADLPVLYQLSQAMLCPAEGQYYSLSMLEAMEAGVPVIVTSGTAQAEIAGDAAVTVDGTPQGWASAFEQVLNDEGLRQRLIARGRDCVTHYTNEHTAKALIQCYDDLFND